MIKSNKTIYIRVDGGPEIGAGHIVRCVSIAKEVEKYGCHIQFISSDINSSLLLEKYGYSPVLTGGNPRHLVERDAICLAKIAQIGSVVLVDSYGVTSEFFDACAKLQLRLVYIDDMYNFKFGYLKRPAQWNIGAVINYSFGIESKDYCEIYCNTSCKQLIGPRYAPVREVFRAKADCYHVRDEVQNILITSGSTNPNKSLEQLSLICRGALPSAAVSVVVGDSASFDLALKKELNISLIKGSTDLSEYMLESDLAISAAGTTLYEFCTLGVPVIAVPIVENQFLNAKGFERLVFHEEQSTSFKNKEELKKKIKFCLPKSRRTTLRQRCRSVINGKGSALIARFLTTF